jgi:hypothetical protein
MRVAQLAMGAALLASAASAQQRVKESVISDPAAADWNFDGKPKVKPVDAAGLPGGKALLVTIARKGTNPWDIQARMKLKDGIVAGDTVTVGFYARAETPDPGKEVATVQVRVQRAAAPYDATLEGPVAIGKDWAFHCLTGPAKVTLDAASAEVSVQLAGEKRAVAFGPWMATRIPAAGPAIKSGLPCGQKVPAA